MAPYTSPQSAKKSPFTFSSKELKEIKLKKSLLTPEFKDNKTLSAIFNGRGNALGTAYEELTILNEDGDPVKKIVRKPETGEYVTVFQKILYLILVELERVTITDVMSMYKGNSKKLTKGQFTGKYDDETFFYVEVVQIAMGFTTAQCDGLAGKNTISAMDTMLSEFKYYNFKGDNISSYKPYIYHNDSVCVKYELYTVLYKSLNENDLSPAANTNKVNNGHVFLYKTPEKLSTRRKAPLDINQTKIHVISDISNYRSGWLLVQTSINNESVIGYCDKNEVWTGSNAPDSEATLYKVVSGDSAYGIAKGRYYHSVDNVLRNDRNTKLKTDVYEYDPILFPGVNIEVGRKEYNQFKFYVNLLLFANNPAAIDTSKSIYLNTTSANTAYSQNNWMSQYESINVFTNPYTTTTNGHYTNYDYFLHRLKQSNNGYHWESDSEISVIEGRYMWKPSKQFADGLYAYIEHDGSYLGELADTVRQKIRDYWPRGYGVEIEGSIGATFGIPIRLGLGGKIFLYRKYTDSDEEIVLCLNKSGTIEAGLDIGVGAGFYAGSGTRKKPDYGLGAKLAAQVNAGISLTCESQYEFPLNSQYGDPDNSGGTILTFNDHTVLALGLSLLSMGNRAVELVAVEFVKAFTDYNIDPENYLTKLRVELDAHASASASATAGLYFGDQESIDYWSNTGAPPQVAKPDWHIRKLMGLANAKLGITAETKICHGFEYTADYDTTWIRGGRLDLKTGSRLPITYSFTLFLQGSYSVNVYAQIAAMGGDVVDLSIFGGLKGSLNFETYYDSTIGKYKSRVSSENPVSLIVSGGSGEWSDYNGSAFELGIALNPIQQTPNSAAGTLGLIDYIFIKKRFDLMSFVTFGAKDTLELRDKLKLYFQNSPKYTKFGLSMGAYVDIEIRTKVSSLVTLAEAFKELLTAMRKEIARKTGVPVESVGWLHVLGNFPDFVSTLNSKSVKVELKDLFFALSEAFYIEDLSFHMEASFGVAAGFQVAAAYKVALDARAKVGITFDQQFVEEGFWIIDPAESPLINQLKGYVNTPEFRKLAMQYSKYNKS